MADWFITGLAAPQATQETAEVGFCTRQVSHSQPNVDTERRGREGSCFEEVPVNVEKEEVEGREDEGDLAAEAPLVELKEGAVVSVTVVEGKREGWGGAVGAEPSATIFLSSLVERLVRAW